MHEVKGEYDLLQKNHCNHLPAGSNPFIRDCTSFVSPALCEEMASHADISSLVEHP